MKLKNPSGGVKKLYTGLTNVLVRTVNPSMEELVGMGRSPQQEPTYLGTTSGDNPVSNLRLDFYVENPETKFNSKISFWLANRVAKSKAGLTKYIDDFNKSGWGDDDKQGLPTFVDAATARPAFEGEEDLLKFIYSWFNVKQGEVCKLETIKNIVSKGDLKELKDMIAEAATQGVRVMAEVIDDKYQGIYNKHFERPYSKTTTYFEKAIANEYTKPKGVWSFDWKEYTPAAVSPDVEGAVEAASPFTPAVDDLPWK